MRTSTIDPSLPRSRRDGKTQPEPEYSDGIPGQERPKRPPQAFSYDSPSFGGTGWTRGETRSGRGAWHDGARNAGSAQSGAINGDVGRKERDHGLRQHAAKCGS